MSNITVPKTELAKLAALRAMERAFPAEALTYKQRKQAWWAGIRTSLSLPVSAKLKVGMESGILTDKRTGQPLTKPQSWVAATVEAVRSYVAGNGGARVVSPVGTELAPGLRADYDYVYALSD